MTADDRRLRLGVEAGYRRLQPAEVAVLGELQRCALPLPLDVGLQQGVAPVRLRPRGLGDRVPTEPGRGGDAPECEPDRVLVDLDLV